ncbi:alkaline phosphatase [Marinomonas sp. CT5]|uniref:PhoX family protein n=1 Tax=Marinomonas sp. CT5 TaxID=2066133 RepID=UPI001BB066A6|nr:alkaline phosphatase PhoX [Marinomonas sp. CT5]QUX95981.1 alkaline phosphatase [Marinomonas sp. CT5]
MTHSVDSNRRRMLGFMAGAPLLPLAGGMFSSAAFAGMTETPLSSVSFVPMAAPSLSNPAAMSTNLINSAMQLKFEDGTSRMVKLDYQPFFMTGDKLPDGNGNTVIAGGYYDINNKPILDPTAGNRQFFSDCPDGSSLLTVKDAKVAGVYGNHVFAVVQFEYTSRDGAGDNMYGKLPSPIAILTLDQNPETGELKLVKYHNVDTSGVGGLWITCGASLSPWGTHLSSEEYEPDSSKIDDKQFKAYCKNLFGDENKGTPYNYGHLPEVTVNKDGTGSIKKHYCMGRLSHELVQVMPDERTVIMGDDATNSGLFMFIADKARDLSSGTLYVAKWHQTSNKGPGAGNISWIKLGRANSDEIKRLVDAGIKSTDIMEIHTEDPKDPSFTKIGYSGKFNWVKLIPGMEKEAAFLETHRYAALVGGSLGFTKMEGTTVNIKDKKAYSAMSYIYKTMTNGSTDIHVEGPKAGAVYEHKLAGGQKDHNGEAIDSEWVSVHMHAPANLIGEDLITPDALGNTAHADRIANPDNIKFSEKLRTLFIGEDSGNHVNNFLWAYNVDSGELSRIMSCPAGAESTGLHAVDEINGWTYIMSNIQHAGDWDNKLHAKVKDTLDPYIRANYKDRYGAAVGYITGVPKI